MTVGSLFSGIGGFDLGLERAGMQVKWQVEIDPYCLKVLEKHWHHVKRYTDIKHVRWEEVEPVDLICGGFPCQPVSLAGKRKGTADERWLWPEFVRCLRVLRPRYVLIENVPGLLVQGFSDVLRDLAVCGYDAEWDRLPAGAFGAHHERQRIYVVASRSDSDCLRRQRKWENPIRTPHWTEFKRLVQYDLSVCIPAGKNHRISDGVSHRMDRLRGLGNAIVPQIAEWIGQRIIACQHS